MNPVRAASALVPLRLRPDCGFHRDLTGRIQTLIEHSDASRAVFAAKTGPNAETLRRSMSDARYWRIDEIIAIADQARTTTSWLLTGRGDGPVPHQSAAGAVGKPLIDCRGGTN